MQDQPFNVLFICTHNSARSIIAEALLRHIAPQRFRSFSAGSEPRADGHVNPMALCALKDHGVPSIGLNSKSWNAFDQLYDPPLDIVITVCDRAAEQQCPSWVGSPGKAHWGYPDPSTEGSSDEERLHAFAKTVRAFEWRIQKFVELSDSEIEQMKLLGTEIPPQFLATTWQQSAKLYPLPD